jgi:hypothetical protein
MIQVIGKRSAGASPVPPTPHDRDGLDPEELRATGAATWISPSATIAQCCMGLAPTFWDAI